MQFKSFTQYVTEETKAITVAWGRFNPPTIGHEKLMKTVEKSAQGTFRIYTSQTYQNQKDGDGYYKDPLPYKDKVKVMRKMFPKYARNIMYTPKIRTMFDLMTALYKEGFTQVNLVAGSDRVREYETTLNKYNNQKGRHGFYNFEGGVNIISAGQRDPDADGASGMSASKLRKYAAAGDLKNFSSGLVSTYSDGKKLMNMVRKGMGLKETYEYRQHIQLAPVSEEREAYIKGDLFAEGDLVVVKENDQIGTVLFCGSNYVLVEMNGGKFRKWLGDVERLPDEMQEGREDPDIGHKKGSQPSIYHKGLSKSTKQKRDAHFKKGAAKDDDDPSAYKPAPGDKTAKTKPSKHTKKFKQMYGEKMNQDRAKARIEREKEADKRKHDRMMDRARMRDTISKNRSTT